jgi:hypothetical protein
MNLGCTWAEQHLGVESHAHPTMCPAKIPQFFKLDGLQHDLVGVLRVSHVLASHK